MDYRPPPSISSPPFETWSAIHRSCTDAVQPALVWCAVWVVSPGPSNLTSSPSSGTSLEDSN